MRTNKKEFTRDNYMTIGQKQKMYNTQNQPYLDNDLIYIYNNFVDDRIFPFQQSFFVNYPDMEAAYDYFSSYLSIPRSNFILTNGCEEALKIVFQVIDRIAKDKKRTNFLFAERPRWGMVDVLANQIFGSENTIINMPYNDFNKDDEDKYNFYCKRIGRYSYETAYFSHVKFLAQKNSNIISYETYRYNNILRHDSCLKEFMETKGKEYYKENFKKSELFSIVDETYTPFKSFDDFLRFKDIDNLIVIGSLSKTCGCGLRLGYILFNEKYSRLFNIYRPQYISALAAGLLQYEPFAEYLRNIKDKPIYSEKPEYIDRAKHLILDYMFFDIINIFDSVVKILCVTPWYCTLAIRRDYHIDKRSALFYRLDKEYIMNEVYNIYRINWNKEEYDFIFDNIDN